MTTLNLFAVTWRYGLIKAGPTAVKEPAIYSLLPFLNGLGILYIGSGFGKMVSFYLQNKAAYALGTDIFQNMISEVKKRFKDPRASFTVVPAEDFKADNGSFNLVVSSMCVHYVSDIKPVFEELGRSSRKNGYFIFSVEHPIGTSLFQGGQLRKCP